ncbi:hypothetical protein ACHAPT_000129 [Fusarium lateritium]
MDSQNPHPSSDVSSTCSLKLYMPIDRSNDRGIIKLNIQSLDKWQQNIAQRCPFEPPWSGPNSTEDLNRQDQSGDVDTETGKQQVQAQQVPERSLLRHTHGDGSGDDVFALKEFDEMKEIEEERLVRIPPLASSVKGSDLSSYSLKGWQLLHKIILDGLTSTDASRIPSYTPRQRAYFIFVDRRVRENGCEKLVARRVQNINACPRNSLMTCLDEVEKRGWRDIIWVGNEGWDVPTNFSAEDEAREMTWG